jgi:hypothetical protein
MANREITATLRIDGKSICRDEMLPAPTWHTEPIPLIDYLIVESNEYTSDTNCFISANEVLVREFAGGWAMQGWLKLSTNPIDCGFFGCGARTQRFDLVVHDYTYITK